MRVKLWLLGVATVFLPIKELMITIGFLVAMDMMVGIWKAIKLGQRIRSRRMSDTITKLLLYQIAIVSGFLIERYVIEQIIPITKLIATVVAIIEFKSIIESIESVTGKDLWNKIKAIIGRKSEDLTDSMTDGQGK
jgi:uncharacterized membrane protein HdeD (DUF308 family)